MRFLPESLLWKNKFEQTLEGRFDNDPAHDILHFRRVLNNCFLIDEDADARILLPAVYFHDWVNVSKADPRRSQASRLSAEAAIPVLDELGYFNQMGGKEIDGIKGGIAHAIEAHSYSAKVEPKTTEARVLQDADRLDALGVIGIARLFSVSGSLGRPFYSASEPFGDSRRDLDDRKYAVDHFFIKLRNLPDQMCTGPGRKLAHARWAVMEQFLAQMRLEIGNLGN